MSKLFISHSSQDDGFVRELRAALADHGQAGWIDSRELRGGDPLWPDIQKAIEDASAYAVVVSTDALQSKWVGKELTHALRLRDERGKDKFPVIPLSQTFRSRWTAPSSACSRNSSARNRFISPSPATRAASRRR
jgi:hypothetical protein